MTQLRLYTLGAPRIEFGARTVELGLRKALALVVYLAVTRQSHTRDHLAALLWPESDQREGRGRLRRTLYSLAEALPAGALDTDGDVVQLRRDLDLWLDCAAFRDAATAGLSAAPDHALDAGRLTHLKRAVELYTAEFLNGFTLPDSPAFDEWQFFQRESLHQLYGQSLEQIVRAYQTAGDFAEAIPYARRWVALDPLHEPAQRTLMRLYAMAGMHAAAVRQYQECARVLEAELGAEPEEQTTALFEAIRDRRIEPPAAKGEALAARPPTVPAGAVRPPDAAAHTRPRHPSQRSPLAHSLPACIGRERELELLRELLTGAAPRRLVTLMGPGGIGKTRLALEAARDLAEAFPDGVFFVDLSAVSAPDLIATAVAEALGLAYHGGYDLEALLRVYLREKRLLLVLDNFEHLLDGAVLLTDLLDGAPALRLLVTSRERLNLRLEQVVEVRGIAYPDDPRADEAASESFAAVQLFLDRARHAQASFALTDADRPHVVRLCRLVEGMPLAIELAANWIRSLSCQEIADEVERSFDILSAAQQDAPPRHHSMRAVLEHTWAGLSTDEQDVLRRLPVFRGGFSREAAHAVAGATLPLLGALVDKGLVRRSTPRRYHLHELIRQFAAEQLERDPEERRRTLDRHMAYYIAALERLTPDVKGSGDRAALDAIAEDADNLRAAWGHAVAAGDVAAIGRAAECLWIAYLVHGRLREGAEAFRLAAAAAGGGRETGLAGFLLAGAGYLSARQGRLEEARRLMDRGIAQMRRSQPRSASHEAFALTWRAYIESSQGRFAEAERLAHEAMAACDEAGDTWSAANSHLLLGIAALGSGRLDAARRHNEACLDISNRTGNQWTRGFAYQNLARIAIERGEYERAGVYLDVVDETFRSLNDPYGLAHGLRERGLLAMVEGDAAQAVELLCASRELFREIRSDWDAALVHAYLGAALHRRGAHAEAELAFQEGLAATRATGHTMEIARNLLGLGCLMAERGDHAAAEQHLREALGLWEDADNPVGTAAALIQLGGLAARAPLREHEAQEHYARALGLALQHGLAPLALEAVLGAAPLLAQMHGAGEVAPLLAAAAGHPAASGIRARAAAYLRELGLDAEPGLDAPPCRVGQGWRALALQVARQLDETLVGAAV